LTGNYAPEGPRGPAGPPGRDVEGYASDIRVVQKTDTYKDAGAYQHSSINVSCPPGMRPVSGGADMHVVFHGGAATDAEEHGIGRVYFTLDPDAPDPEALYAGVSFRQKEKPGLDPTSVKLICWKEGG
jgi:hypothetical protein